MTPLLLTGKKKSVIALTTFSSHGDQAVTHISITQSGERQNVNAIIGERHQARYFRNKDAGLYGKIELWSSFGFVDIQYSITNDYSILVAWRDFAPTYDDRGEVCSLCCNICWWLVGDWGEYQMKQGKFSIT